MYFSFLLLYCVSCVFAKLDKRQMVFEEEVTKLVLQMPGYSPSKNDEYGVLPRRAPPGYIVAFEPFAVMDRIHHILIFGCSKPAHNSIWKGYDVCGGGLPRVLYAWARNGPLCKNICRDVLDYSGVIFHMTQKKPPNIADVYLLGYTQPVPPGRHHIQLNVSCEYHGRIDLHPFAFRTHTHGMGRVVSAYYKHEGHWKKLGIRYPLAPQNDEYGVLPREAPPGYIVAFEPFAVMDRIHHILIFGCSKPAHNSIWKGYDVCGGGLPRVIYAWARNAPALYLPNNVAYSVGHEHDHIKYFVMQVHYARTFVGDVLDYSGVIIHMTQKKPPNIADVYLLGYTQPVPPGRHQIQLNVSCEYHGKIDLHPFAFRTHTHGMGRVVSAYYKHEGHWKKLGIRYPLAPQIFQIIEHNPVIRKGDLIATTCRMDSHHKTVPTPIGPQEMCNFYMMYYYNSSEKNPFPGGPFCVGNERSEEVRKEYPIEGTLILPSKPTLERTSYATGIAFGVIEEGAHTSIGGVKLGQIAALSFVDDQTLVIFHRAGRVWNKSSFDKYDVMNDKTPIADYVILIVTFIDGKVRLSKRLGKNKFYMPHGLHIDKDNFFYTTDAGSHTVAKWRLEGDELELVWESGVKMKPGADDTHFCKPTAIVTNDEGVFVTDGYCNNRIVQLDSTSGKRMFEFGLSGPGHGTFSLPHDIVTSFPSNHLFVADRENGKVQELTTRGDFVLEWSSNLFSNIYSVDTHDDYVYMVPGRVDRNAGTARVYAGRAGTGLIEFSFAPTSRKFEHVHTLRVSPDGYRIAVGDNHGPTLFLFRIQPKHPSSFPRSPFMFSTSFYLLDAERWPLLIIPVIGCAMIIIGFVVCLRNRREQKATRNHVTFDKKDYKALPLDKEDAVKLMSDNSDIEEP